MKLPKFSGLRLQADIEQCEAALTDKANSLERGCASVRKDLRSLRREVNKHKDCKDPETLKPLVAKRDLLKLRVQALEKEQDDFVAQQRKKLSLLISEIHAKFERMHGLLNYGLATGGLGPTPGLLFNELSDFLAAKTEGDRDSAERAVNLILAHGNVFGDKEQTTDDINDRVLTQFEAITDPEECSRFYAKNRDEIQRGFEARKNNQS
jgi:hypothetical protein